MRNNKKNWKEIEEKFIEEQGLPFKNVLSEEEVEKALEKEGIKYRKRLLTPIITIWAFLSQVLDGDSSCRKAAERVLAFFICKGVDDVSLTDSAYCQARARLKESFLGKLVCSIGKNQSNSVEEEHLWCGRRVKVMDAGGILMADTEKNQEEYQQYYNCKPGCGYPIARMAILFCLVTGMVLEMYLAPKEVSERTLFRRFYQNLSPGDVVLGDRGCGSYADIVKLADQRVDSVFRVCASKKLDFSNAIAIGHKDYIMQWQKPNRPQTSSWTPEEYSVLPSTIWVRVLEYNLERRGYRTKKVSLVTTLFDSQVYSKEDLMFLYYRRWETELNIRHIKTTLKMELINCKTPEMVRKSIWVHLLAYNLIRRVMWEAAMLHNVPPMRISFKGTIDRINVFLPQIASAPTAYIKRLLYEILFWNIAKDLLPMPIKRKKRIYARCVKPRKNYPWISCSRSEYRKKILSNAM